MVDGLEYGLNFPVFKSSVTSRKLTTFLFASTVIFSSVVRKYLAYLFFCFLYLPWCLIEYGKPVISVKADFDFDIDRYIYFCFLARAPVCSFSLVIVQLVKNSVQP